jgi:hypothetical protein
MGTIEVWKPVVGYEGAYEVSAACRIASLPRKGRLWRRILKPGINSHGCPQVALYLHGVRTAHLVAHLVADAFLPPKRPTDTVVRHLNDDPSDNRIENLAWGTHHDNAQDSIRNGTFQHGVLHWCAKLTEDIVREIRLLYATGNFTQKELALKFGVSQTTLSAIVRRETWKHVS